MTAFEMRPRSVTEIVDAAFELLRRDYVTLITISAVFQLPLLLLQLTMNLDLTTPQKIMENLEGLGVLSLLGLIALSLADAAIIHSVSEIYLGRKSSVGRSIGLALRRVLPLSFAGVIRFIVSYVLLFPILFPGFYIYSRWATVRAVIVLEDRGTFDALGRSWGLAQERVGPSFLTLLLGYVIVLVLWVVFMVIVSLAGAGMTMVAQTNVSMALQRLPAIFVYPFVSVLTTLMYYDLRVRKEAFDLELMASELDAPAASA